MNLGTGPGDLIDPSHGTSLINDRHNPNSKHDKASRRRPKHSSKRDKTRQYFESRSRSASRSFTQSPFRYSRSYSHSPFDHTPSPDRRPVRHKGSVYGRGTGYRSRSHSYTPPRSRGTHYRGGGAGNDGGFSPPTSSRRRFYGDRELPQPSRVLGVFGLNIDTKEKEVKDIFRRFGPMEKVVIVYDHQTGRSRGFAFVYFEDTADAEDAKQAMNGYDMQGRKIRVDFSITKRPHTPTPGIYMGKPSSSTKRRSERERDRDRYGSGFDYHDRESRYPRGRAGYYRSRSRSYSPRYHPQERGFY